MLSDAQLELVTLKVNAETDIPFLRESAEEKIIEKVLSVVNEKLEPSLLAFCPRSYVDCLKIALQDGIPAVQKRAQICEILQSVLAEPLAEQMAGMIDVSLMPESMEEKVMGVICKKIVEEFVEWTVGEIDERMNERLVESREFDAS